MILMKISFKLALFICLISLITGLALIGLLFALKLVKKFKLKKQNKILNNVEKLDDPTSILSFDKSNTNVRNSFIQETKKSNENTNIKSITKCGKFAMNKYDKMDLSNIESRYLNFNGDRNPTFNNYLQKSNKPFLGYYLKENKPKF